MVVLDDGSFVPFYMNVSSDKQLDISRLPSFSWIYWGDSNPKARS